MKQAFAKLHISVVLAGFTGILGKLITLNEGLLVWYRMLLTSLLIMLMYGCTKRSLRVPFRSLLRIAGVGVLLALHWVFFYGSIKASNVSIGVVCFSTVGFFTAIFEPLAYGRKISVREIFFSFIALAGILLIFHFDSRYQLGIAMGVVSAALASLLTIGNKKIGERHETFTMLFWEMVSGFIFLAMVLPLYFQLIPTAYYVPTLMDGVYLLLLCVFCTIIMYLLQIQSLKSISAFTVSLSYNLEPLYSITLAALIWGEQKELNLGFYLGLGLIVFSVLLQTYSMWMGRRKAALAPR